jgi:hypothetical protein
MYYIMIKKFHVEYPCGLQQQSKIYSITTKNQKPYIHYMNFKEALEEYKTLVRTQKKWYTEGKNTFGDFQHCCDTENAKCTVTVIIKTQKTILDHIKEWFKK